MDSEGDPFETPLEREYNRILGEMAQQKEDCENRIEELQQKLRGHEKGAGDTSGGKVAPVRGPGDLVGNVTHDTSSGHEGGFYKNETVVKRPVDVHSGTGSGSHNSSFGHSSNSSIPSSGTGNHTVFHSDGFLNVSTPGPHNDTVPAGGGCVPCPDLRDACGPTAPSQGDSCASPMVLATPEAILVGAAAAVLVLVVAAAVAIIVRYLPNITSGLLIIAVIVLVWYCSSMYPEAARRLGTRILGALRSAATSVVDRVLGRRHPEVKYMYCMCRGICEEMVFKESKDKERVGV
jgi:hypothetical protein